MTDAEIDAFLNGGTHADVGAGEAPSSIGDAEIDAFLGSPKDMGPSARRAQAGKHAQPREHSDSELGLDPGMQASAPPVPSAPILERVFKGMGTPTALPQPTTAADAAEQDKLRTAYQTTQELDKARRSVGALAATGPMVAAGKGAAAALGAGPRVAEMVGGAAAGAGTSAASGGSATDVAASAAGGAALSGLMGFVAKKVATNATKKPFLDYARKGEQGAQETLTDMGHERVGNVINKYGLGSIDKPIVAHDAVNASITRVEATIQQAKEAIRRSGDNTQLANESAQRLKEAVKDLQVLQTLKPITGKLAVAEKLKQSMKERLTSEPMKVGKEWTNKAIAAPIHLIASPVTVTDKILSSLILAKKAGSLTPDMLQAAISAGVSPAIVHRLAQ